MPRGTELQKAKEREQILRIERRGRIEAWNEYVGFAVSKVAGATALVVGSIQYAQPTLLALHVTSPGPLAGVGLALLIGPRMVNVLGKIFNALKT
jgi:hypothetical protein